MADKGEWKLYDYEYESKKLENKIERTLIEVDKIRIQKREIENSLGQLDLNISDKLNNMDLIRDKINWCKGKIKELKDE